MINNSRREYLNDILFNSNTKPGKIFDVVLFITIILSIVIVTLDSVQKYNQQYGILFKQIEWVITIIFTVEYVLRIIVSKNTSSYIFGFYGIIDFMSLIPTYLTYIFIGTQSLVVIRTLRLLRIFRVLKLTRYSKESQVLVEAIKASRRKIGVFIFVIFTIVIIVGTVMYLVEGSTNGFHSIPRSMYWTIVTITTVGYGDISPQTPLGQLIASFLMLIGYAIIAVPTGIVTVELSRQFRPDRKKCEHCENEENDIDAVYCKNCGKSMVS
ncbi:ion transporter [Bacteroidota bacterium]